MTYIKVNGMEYPAEISGRIGDRSWNGRDSKGILLKMSCEKAKELFVDGVGWSVIDEQTGDSGVTVRTEYDNSDYCLAGDITDHRDGSVTVKLGRLTEAEELMKLIESGVVE